MSGVNWGDVPTWFGGAFAALAFGAAAWTLKSQRDQISEQRVFIGEQSATLALEREALRAAAEERKWAQARQIEMLSHMGYELADGEGNVVEADHWVVTIVNGSDAPVHGVEVRFGDAYRASEVFECARGASGWLVGERQATPVYLLGPGRASRFLSQGWPIATVHNNRPSVAFTDDDGVRWTLDAHGKLEEASPAPGT
ncbi:hypothetical protein [Streptomyces phaeochromogenes]|uniref:hypothetical protein n=1 Tax=Streptomyces phaeochromogenes TaxID=1923 RepID=UPI002DDAEDBE|nr:hypothetical protein [Streptomyces phaeochromogenes]WRZ30195.1 hypothetical protein OG931_21815 [Streptomyces phaeochromogenes]